MNIISWNVLGLGRTSKRFLVRDFLDLYNGDICYIQESMLAYMNSSLWRLIGGSQFNCFNFTLAQGTSGGMIVGWKSSRLKGTLIHFGPFCLTMEFSNMQNQNSWLWMTRYGPNSIALKTKVWTKLWASAASKTLP